MNTSSLVCSVVLNFTNGQIIMLSDHTPAINADPKCGRTSKGYATKFNDDITKFDDDITNNDKKSLDSSLCDELTATFDPTMRFKSSNSNLENFHGVFGVAAFSLLLAPWRDILTALLLYTGKSRSLYGLQR